MLWVFAGSNLRNKKRFRDGTGMGRRGSFPHEAAVTRQRRWNNAMMMTLSRLYVDGATARAIVDELQAAGLPQDDIGIIAPSRGAAGLLGGLSAFVLPEIGAVAAAGWLARALTGAAGGMAGALISAGVSENDAAGYAEGVRRGGTLLTLRVMEQDRTFYEDILATAQAGGVRHEPAILQAPRRGLNQLTVKRT
jgi:hypothetical protein